MRAFNVRRRLATAALLAFLTACAGVAEMRADQPFAYFASNKHPDELAACIAEAWIMQDRWPQTPDVRVNAIQGGKQVMIYNAHSMSPDAFVDIVAGEAASRISYYAKYRQAYRKTFAELTETCL